WYQGWGTIPGPNGMLLIRPNVVSRNATFDGLIIAPGTSLHGLAFRPDGSYAPFQSSDLTSGHPLGVPPSRQSITNGGSGDNLGAEVATIMPEVERDNLFAYFGYDLSDTLAVYAHAIGGSNRTERLNSPRGSLAGPPAAVTIFQDNAFLPEEIRQTMIAEGIPSFTFRRMGSKEDIGADIRLWDDSEMLSFTGGFRLAIQGGA